MTLSRNLAFFAAHTLATAKGTVLATNGTTIQSGSPPCDALINAGLQDLLVFPTSAAYESSIQSYWAASARLHPWCIAQPRSTQNVSKVFNALVDVGDADWAIAVRGGGHSQWAGAANIDNGITIDLSLMNATSYDASTNLASIGPGGDWVSVYEALAPYNVTVVGARDAGVGRSGYLLGGGNSYYTGRQGFGCDAVGNFEVVLTNGSVVNANNSTNTDLFKALKGGGSNFGIVTRFDLEAIPFTYLWAGAISYTLNHSEPVIDAFVDFANLPQSAADDACVILWMYESDLGEDVFVTSSLVNAQGNTNTTSFEGFLSVPSTSGNTMSIVELAPYTVSGESPSGFMSVWFTLTFKNDASIIRKAVQLHNELVATLKTVLGPENFKSEIVFQPIPSYFADLGAAKGGNVLPLSSTENSVLFLMECNTLTLDNEAVCHAHSSAMVAEIEAYAESVGGNMPWRYLNYADASQSPLASYGVENIDFLKQVAASYDPKGIFQTRVPGGFKISRV